MEKNSKEKSSRDSMDLMYFRDLANDIPEDFYIAILRWGEKKELNIKDLNEKSEYELYTRIYRFGPEDVKDFERRNSKLKEKREEGDKKLSEILPLKLEDLVEFYDAEGEPLELTDIPELSKIYIGDLFVKHLNPLNKEDKSRILPEILLESPPQIPPQISIYCGYLNSNREFFLDGLHEEVHEGKHKGEKNKIKCFTPIECISEEEVYCALKDGLFDDKGLITTIFSKIEQMDKYSEKITVQDVNFD